MAEIHIQRKNRTGWIWALAILALLIALFWWWSVGRGRDTEGIAGGETAPAVVSAGAPWVATVRFITFTRDSGAMFGDMTGAHQYTRNGLRYLADALEEVRGQRPDAGAASARTIAALRAAADSISEGATAPAHAGTVAPVLVRATDAMSTLQRERFPEAGDEIDAARSAAVRVRADQPLLDQKEAIQTYFARAVDALRAMGAPPPGNAGARDTTTGGQR